MATFLDDPDETLLVSIPLDEGRPASDHSSIASAPSVASSAESSSTTPTIATATTTTEDDSVSSFSRSSCDTASVITTISDNHSDRNCSPRTNLTLTEDQLEVKQPSQGTAYIDAWETQILDYAIPSVKPPSSPTSIKTAIMRDSRRDSRDSFQTHQRRRSSSWSGHQRYSKPEIDFPPMQSLSDIASESSVSDLSEISSLSDFDSDDDGSDKPRYHVTPPAPLTNRTVLVAYCGDTAASLQNNPDTTVLDMLDLISCLTGVDDTDKKFKLPHPKKTLSKRLSHQSINASSRKLASLLGPDFAGPTPARPPTSSSFHPGAQSPTPSLFRRRSLLPLRRSPSNASLAPSTTAPVRRASGPASISLQNLASSRSCDFRDTTTSASSPRSSFLRSSPSQNPRNSFLSVPGSDSSPPRNRRQHDPYSSFSSSFHNNDDDAIDDIDEEQNEEDFADSCAPPPDILLAPNQNRYHRDHHQAYSALPSFTTPGMMQGVREGGTYNGDPYADGGVSRGGRRLSRLSSIFSGSGSGRSGGVSWFVQ